MQNGNSQLSTEVTGQGAAGARPARRDAVTMFDSVKVDPATFASVIFLGSEERKEFVEGQNIPHNQKRQATTKEGVPVWTLKLYAENWRGLERQLKVNVAMADDPAERFGRGEPVTLSDVEYGVTPKREGNGFVVWFRAGTVKSAGDRKPVGAVA